MAASNDNTFSRKGAQFQPSSTATSHPVHGLNSPQNTPRRSATTHALDKTVPQQRRPSLPPQTMPEGLSTWQAPHPDTTAPALGSTPSSPEHRLVDHASRPVERATDPRKRTRAETPSTRSSSSGPALPATATAPPPMASSSSNTLAAPAASPASNSAPEKDTQMADETDASPVDLIARLFIVFMETGIAAEVAKAQNSQAKAEADRAAQIYNNALEKTRNKTPIHASLERNKKGAEQDFNKTSEQLASASESRYSAARELATGVLKLFQDYSTQTSKSLEQESSDRHTELRSCIERLDRLESIQANASTGVDDSLLMSLESRVATLEANAVSNHDQIMHKINALREEDQKQIDSLHGQVTDLSGQLDSLSARVNRVLDLLSDQEQDLRNPQKPESQLDLERQITQLQMDVAGLAHELTSMRAEMQKPTDPLAASPMFHGYVKRYQRDRAEDAEKLNTIAGASSMTNQKLQEHETKTSSSLQVVEARIAAIAEASSVTSQKLQDHETKTSSSLQAVDAKMAAWEASQALLEDSVAGIKQDQSNQAQSVPTELETELRLTAASHSHDLSQLKLFVDNSIELERRHKEETSKKIQQLESFTRTLDQNLSKQVAANEHSIKSLTARYNNLSSDQLAKRMAHHVNLFPSTLLVEQNSLKARMDRLEARHDEQKVTLDTINATIRDDALRSSSDETSRQNFENRMKTEYYDVLEDKVRENRDDIRGGIEGLRSRQDLISDCCENLEEKVYKYHNETREDIESLRSELSLIESTQKALQHHVDELERKALLSTFQQTTNQKTIPLPEISHQGLSEPSDSLSGKAECDNIINSFGKRRPSDQVEDSIVVKPPPSSSRKRPR